VRLTTRDQRLVRDLALSHVLSRDQIIKLGHFSSVTRTNARLLVLRRLDFVRRIETPFFAQSLYMAGPMAAQITGERIALLLKDRADSPRFLQHALTVTNVRLALLAKGADSWTFEQQLRRSFTHQGRAFEVRPDGLVLTTKGPLAIEVDLGHASLPKLAQKLAAFDLFLRSGECEVQWGFTQFNLLITTTGSLRCRHIERLIPKGLTQRCAVQTLADLGADLVGGWS